MSQKNTKQLQDKRIWERIGWELFALHLFISAIHVDPEYQSVMVCKIWDRFFKMTDHLIQIRGNAESRMARFVPDWSARIFYPIDTEALEAAVAEFRRKLKEGTPHS